MNQLLDVPVETDLFIAKSNSADKIYYSGRPSQACNFSFFAWCAAWIFISILATIFISAYWSITPLIGVIPVSALGLAVASRAINTHAIEFLIDSDRITWKTGVVDRVVSSVEIYRIQNVTMSQNLIDGTFGIGHVYIQTIDQTHPLVHLFGIAAPEKVREWLTEYAQVCRARKPIREYSNQ